MRPDARVPLSAVLPEWLHRPLLPIQLAKEVRIALPTWVLAWFVPAAVLTWAHGEPNAISFMIYLVFCGVLGGNMFGSEYTHRTLGLLLSQPVSRRRLWGRKMGLLAAALFSAALPLLIALSLAEPHQFWISLGWTIGPVLSGLCFGPWLSLLTRSALAGSVLSMASPFVILMVTLWLGGYLHLTEQARMVLFGVVLAAMWMVALILGYRGFVLAEPMEGRPTDLRLPGWRILGARRASEAARPGGYLLQLFAKELRLQQVSFLLAFGFWAAWLVYAWATREQDGNRFEYLELAVQAYVVVLALLIGALTCAEERQFGTLQWQLTCPCKVSTQWSIKVTVALLLALLLACVMPMGLLRLSLFEGGNRDLPEQWLDRTILSGGVLGLTALASYASALSATTVRAFLSAAVLAMGFAGLAWVIALAPVGHVLSFFFWSWTVDPLRADDRWVVAHAAFATALSLATVGAVLRFGLAIYRRVDLEWGPVALHALLLLALFGLTCSLWGFLANLQ